MHRCGISSVGVGVGVGFGVGVGVGVGGQENIDQQTHYLNHQYLSISISLGSWATSSGDSHEEEVVEVVSQISFDHRFYSSLTLS